MPITNKFTFSPPVDPSLIAECEAITFNTAPASIVLWSGSPNRIRAEKFCKSGKPGEYVMLDQYLQKHHPELLKRLTVYGNDFPSEAQELWGFLSQQFVASATGSAYTFSFAADFPDHILKKIHESLHLPAVPIGILDVIPLSAWLQEFFALLESEEANEQMLSDQGNDD